MGRRPGGVETLSESVMDLERLFLKINGVLCFGVAVNFLWNAGFIIISRWDADPTLARNLDQYLEKFLRDLAGGSPFFLSLANFLPVLMMFSLMLAFFFYLNPRSKAVSGMALICGTLFIGVFVARQVSGAQLTQVAMRFVQAADYSTKMDLMKEARSLYGLYLFQELLVNRASIISYALFGFLFRKGTSVLEEVVGYSFVASAVVFILHLLTSRMDWWLADPVALTVPAISFALAGVALLKAKKVEKLS
jgi:hypothetical protein